MKFNEKKATQAASRLLGHADKRMNAMKLITLLYLVDRAALLRWSRPVTGDEYLSMEFGPALISVRDLTDEKPHHGHEGFWARYISPLFNDKVTLLQEAGRDELSEAEEGLIDEIYRDFGRLNPSRLAERLREILPEWTPPTEGYKSITYTDILKAGKKSPEEISAFESDLEELQLIDTLFSAR